MHKIRQKIIDFSKMNGLSITTNVNKRVVYFLDLTLDMNSSLAVTAWLSQAGCFDYQPVLAGRYNTSQLLLRIILGD